MTNNTNTKIAVSSNRKRSDVIDTLKGTGILLVVIGHVSQNYFLNVIIYSFHMPLFFFISGLLFRFSLHKENFLFKKIKSLIIPYLCFSIMTFAYWALIEYKFRGDYSIDKIHQFFNIFIANTPYEFNIVLWFLPCLFCVELIVYLFLKILDNSFSWLLLLIIVLVASNYYYAGLNVILPWFFNITIIVIPFFVIGHLAHGCIIGLVKLSKFSKLVLIMYMLTGWYLFAINPIRIDLASLKYPNPLIIMYPISFVGIITVCIFHKLLNNKILTFLGINSLTIMCVHEPLKRIVIKITSIILKVDTTQIRNEFIWIIIISLLVISITIPIANIIKRYFPFILGKL